MKQLTRPPSPAPLQLSLCMFRDSRTLITLIAKLHVQACGHLSRQSFLGGESAAGGPLIIFNTAVPERLKTKSQLRKELWGWSKAPRAAMQDERTLDSDCICDLSPLNLCSVSLLYVSLGLTNTHFHLYSSLSPSFLLLIHPLPHFPFRLTQSNCLHLARLMPIQKIYLKCKREFTFTFQQKLNCTSHSCEV